jgi:hypothetical protein
MTYTINGKQYTESDINERCAEIMKVTVLIVRRDYKPCNNPSDTDAIIDKCLDELTGFTYIDNNFIVRWNLLMNRHNCTKLIAACICLIELNE